MAVKFINPYNFIPFDSKVEPVRDRNHDEELVSGCIEYSVRTRTPLIIPNTSNDNIFGFKNGENCDEYHKSYEFFSYEDLSEIKGSPKGKMPMSPVIPGSEVRGMFRANYEIITDSCLPFLDSDQILHKRVAGFFSAGLIKKNGDKFDLYEAEDCLLRTKGENDLDTSDQDYDKENDANKEKYNRKSYIQSGFKEGQRVFVQKQSRGSKVKSLITKISQKKDAICSVEGYIIKGMKGPKMSGRVQSQNKHCAHVFAIKSNNIVCKSIDITRLDDTLDMYLQNDRNAYCEYISEWKTYKYNDLSIYFPVYYSVIGEKESKKIYLSPASGTMETYKKSISDLVASKCACKNLKKLCPACSLFGTVNVNGEGVASKVRFSDLKLKNNGGESLYEKVTDLQELSSPKLQNMEFYLKRPSDNAQFWTYEYWVDFNGRVHLYDEKNRLELNGRKFYWHSKTVAAPAQENNERNITIRPIKSGVEFKGSLYFEKITNKELNELIWLVNCGDYSNLSEKKHGYKLGHAKPLGYGSIEIGVDKVSIRTIDKSKEMINVMYADKTEEKVAESKNAFVDSDIKTNFKKMTDFDFVSRNSTGATVMYPKISETGPVFEWFVLNHGKRTKSGGKFETGSMVKTRNEMAFGEYMVPLEVGLKKIQESFDEKNISYNNKGNYKKNYNSESSTERSFKFRMGDCYEFKVINYKKGKDGKPLDLVMELVSNKNVKISIPFYIIEKNSKGKDATCVKKESVHKLICDSLGDNQKWKKA